MEELDKVLQALDVVERYEEYLFRKIWGKMLIVIGIVFPLGALISLNATILASVIGLDADVISLLANVIIFTLLLGYIAYSFYESWKTVGDRPDEESQDSLHGPLIGIVWFLSFVMTSFTPEALRLVSLLWAASVACLLTFLILRAVGSHGRVKILLLLGISLGVISFPLLLVSDTVLLGYLALTAFSLCFIIAGLAMNRMATAMLRSRT
ncbi:hypothetical protein EU538_02065 [Candidatus Thorarchaeota archaeon]|nr:MAG: hypothetical protein EU538_02065 [Candidatus Thorarchaeota archaeon]